MISLTRQQQQSKALLTFQVLITSFPIIVQANTNLKLKLCFPYMLHKFMNKHIDPPLPVGDLCANSQEAHVIVLK